MNLIDIGKLIMKVFEVEAEIQKLISIKNIVERDKCMRFPANQYFVTAHNGTVSSFNRSKREIISVSFQNVISVCIVNHTTITRETRHIKYLIHQKQIINKENLHTNL